MLSENHEMFRAGMIVEAIMENLKGRSQFDWWWDDIDDDVKKEIIESLKKIVCGFL